MLVTMADLSDDLTQVDEMYALYLQGFDLVCGSRYMKGGRLIGGPFFKQLLSRISGLSSALSARDSHARCDQQLQALRRGYGSRPCRVESVAGFELGLELTVKAFLNGYRIAEIPSTWRDRTAGSSRFRILEWLPHYLKWYFYAFQPVRKHERAVRSAGSSPPERSGSAFRQASGGWTRDRGLNL